MAVTAEQLRDDSVSEAQTIRMDQILADPNTQVNTDADVLERYGKPWMIDGWQVVSALIEAYGDKPSSAQQFLLGLWRDAFATHRVEFPITSRDIFNAKTKSEFSDLINDVKRAGQFFGVSLPPRDEDNVAPEPKVTVKKASAKKAASSSKKATFKKVAVAATAGEEPF